MVGDLLSTEIHVVGAAILEGATCLVAQRGDSMSESRRWEFPGGKVEPGEAPEAALAREIEEELDCRIRVGALLGTGRAALPSGVRIRLDVYEAELAAGAPRPREHSALKWAGSAELEQLLWAPADVPVVSAVAGRLRPAQARSCSRASPVANPPTRPK